MDEDVQQRITFLLQEIDANICAAHRSATEICSTVRRHHQILRQIHDAARVWRPLFESFMVQHPTRPRQTKSSITQTNEKDDQEETKQEEANDRSFVQPVVYQEDEEFNEDADEELIRQQHDFKTTTLRNHINDSMDESLNMSMGSDKLPAMARTPYIKTPAVGSSTPSYSIISEERRNWTPAMSSPPRRTDLLETNPTQARAMASPPSAISSVPCDPSPGINKNLMKIGAFEYTPRPGANSKPNHPDAPDLPPPTPASPEMPAFATIHSPVTLPPLHPQENENPEPQSAARKRKRTQHEPPASASSSIMTPPSFSSAVGQHAPPSVASSVSSFRSPTEAFGLRRKYALDHTPSVPPGAATPQKTTLTPQKSMTVDEPLTPNFDLGSPLLSTRLKAMTPHTPLSNRLVGANLDVGSFSQESKLQEYEESFTAGEPAPEFQLALFPAAFQRGIGAVQISSLYSKFHGADDSEYPAFSVDQLNELLPDFGKEKIEILLDTLVSRRLLRPFVIEGTMYWQIPS